MSSKKSLIHWSDVFGAWLCTVLLASVGIAFFSMGQTSEAKSIGVMLLLLSLPFLIATLFLGVCVERREKAH